MTNEMNLSNSTRVVLRPHVVLVLLSMMSMELIGADSDWDDFLAANEPDFAVIPGSNSHLVESKEQQADWTRAMSVCNPRNLEIPLTAQCLSALTEYFKDEPVWDYANVYYYDPIYGLRLTEWGLNRRHQYLPYGYDDYALDEIPRWRDIFDDRLEQRMELDRRIRTDAICEDLRLPSTKGIHEEKSERCQAREMYKYATYLDACVTSLKRFNFLNLPTSKSYAFRHLSVYETSERMIAEHIDEGHFRQLASQRLKKGYLQSAWAIEKCQHYVLLPVEGGVWSSKSRPPKDSAEDNFHDRNVLDNYVALLRVAAKSGDEWAIQSFQLGLFTSDDFNGAVRERYPLLMHRHLGSPNGGFRSELDLTDRKRHQAKAFLLLEKQAGSAVAEREFNVAELAKEIEFVRQGGTLKYPDSMDKILEESGLNRRASESVDDSDQSGI